MKRILTGAALLLGLLLAPAVWADGPTPPAHGGMGGPIPAATPAPTPQPTPTPEPPPWWRPILNIVFPVGSLQEAIREAIRGFIEDSLDSLHNAFMASFGRWVTMTPGILTPGGGAAELPVDMKGVWNVTVSISAVLWPVTLAITAAIAAKDVVAARSWGIGDLREALLNWLIAAAAAGTSIYWLDVANRLTNGVTRAILGMPVDWSALSFGLLVGTVGAMFAAGPVGFMVAIIVFVVALATLAALILQFLARYALLYVLVATAPIVITISVLPPTRWLRWMWIRGFVLVELVGPVNALLIKLVLAMVNISAGTGFVPALVQFMGAVGILSLLLTLDYAIIRFVFGAISETAAKGVATVTAVATMALAAASGVVSGAAALGGAGTGAVGAGQLGRAAGLSALPDAQRRAALGAGLQTAGGVLAFGGGRISRALGAAMRGLGGAMRSGGRSQGARTPAQTARIRDLAARAGLSAAETQRILDGAQTREAADEAIRELQDRGPATGEQRGRIRGMATALGYPPGSVAAMTGPGLTRGEAGRVLDRLRAESAQARQAALSRGAAPTGGALSEAKAAAPGGVGAEGPARSTPPPGTAAPAEGRGAGPRAGAAPAGTGVGPAAAPQESAPAGRIGPGPAQTTAPAPGPTQPISAAPGGGAAAAGVPQTAPAQPPAARAGTPGMGTQAYAPSGPAAPPLSPQVEQVLGALDEPLRARAQPLLMAEHVGARARTAQAIVGTISALEAQGASTEQIAEAWDRNMTPVIKAAQGGMSLASMARDAGYGDVASFIGARLAGALGGGAAQAFPQSTPPPVVPWRQAPSPHDYEVGASMAHQLGVPHCADHFARFYHDARAPSAGGWTTGQRLRQAVAEVAQSGGEDLVEALGRKLTQLQQEGILPERVLIRWRALLTRIK